MDSRAAASALALGIVLTAIGSSGAAQAQSNDVAAIPRVATTTTSHAASCDRACLEGFVDRYFAAVIADDPSAVPLARNVRFTENGQVLPLGEGLWKSMKSAGKYRLAVADPEAGQIALITTVVEDHADPAQWARRRSWRCGSRSPTAASPRSSRSSSATAMTAQRVEALGAPRARSRRRSRPRAHVARRA